MLRTDLLVALVVVIFVICRSDTATLGSIVSTKTATGTGTGTSGTSQTGTGASSILSLGSSEPKINSTTGNIQTLLVAPTKNSTQDNVNTIIGVVSSNFFYKWMSL